MHMCKLSGKGFTLVEALLILLVISIIGFSGYYVWHAQHNTVSSKAASTKTSTVNTDASSAKNTPSDPYAGWKTYTSTYQGISFRYPANWSLTTQQGNDTAGIEADLASPGGFKLTYKDVVSGLGGACQPGDPNVDLTHVEQITTANSPHPLYLVESGDQIGLDMEDVAPTVGDTGMCLFYPLISGDKIASSQIGFSTRVSFPAGTPETIAANQAQDFATAKLILQSFKY